MSDAPRHATAYVPGHEFDALAALRTMTERGEDDVIEHTRLRLLWLRREEPGARVETEVASLAEQVVVVRAVITLQAGAVASGLAAERTSAQDAVERAETRAIGRALDGLGFVLMPVPGVETPEPTVTTPQQTAPEESTERGGAPEPASPERSRPAVVDAVRRVTPDQPVAQVATEPKADDDDVSLADYSWTEFWRVARPMGFDKAKVEETIQQPMQNMTPAQVRAALRERGVDI